jgi:hypothetical protein
MNRGVEPMKRLSFASILLLGALVCAPFVATAAEARHKK